MEILSRKTMKLSVTPLGEKAYSEAELLVDQTIEERISVMHESERETFYYCARVLCNL